MFDFSLSLNVILTSGKVPHEISPVHVVQLVDKEELDVIPLGRDFTITICPHWSWGNLTSFDAAQPVFVGLCVCIAVHAREEHILSIFVIGLMTHYFVAVLFIGSRFLLPLIHGSAFPSRHIHILRPLLSVPVWRRMSVRRTKDGFHIVTPRYSPKVKMSSGEFWSIGVLVVERITIKAYEEYPTIIIMMHSKRCLKYVR